MGRAGNIRKIPAWSEKNRHGLKNSGMVGKIPALSENSGMVGKIPAWSEKLKVHARLSKQCELK
jgi:hypothetical protein